MNQSSHLTRKFADAQEARELHNLALRATANPLGTQEYAYRGGRWITPNPSVVYRIYTEFFPNLLELTGRYFPGATLYFATGLYEGKTEQGGVIEIVATRDDLQKVVHLAGDLKHVNKQSSVLITSAGVTAVSI